MSSVISQEVYEAGSHLLTIRVKTVLSFSAELCSFISLIALLFRWISLSESFGMTLEFR